MLEKLQKEWITWKDFYDTREVIIKRTVTDIPEGTPAEILERASGENLALFQNSKKELVKKSHTKLPEEFQMEFLEKFKMKPLNGLSKMPLDY